MLNIRKIKKDFSSSILQQGKELYDEKMVVSAKILKLSGESVSLSCQVLGNFENTYSCELEIDRTESMIIDSDCDCTYKYDCQHLAAVIFYLEKFLDKLIVEFSKESDVVEDAECDEDERETIKETIKQAESKEKARKGKKVEKELLGEYAYASRILRKSPLFLPEEHLPQDKAELLLIYSNDKRESGEPLAHVEVQLSLRLPYRSKPLNVSDTLAFVDAVRYGERFVIGNRRFNFNLASFDVLSQVILKNLIDHLRRTNHDGEAPIKMGRLDLDAFGMILAAIYDHTLREISIKGSVSGKESPSLELPRIYYENLENPLHFTTVPAQIRFEIDYCEVPEPKLFLNPMVVLEKEVVSFIQDILFLESAKPGVIYHSVYYRFSPHIRRRHLRSLEEIQRLTIPEALFGTFVENSLPELMRFADVTNRQILENFVTLPFTGNVEAECDLQYLDGELDAKLWFLYGEIKIPAAPADLKASDMEAFVTDKGVLARNLVEEQQIVDELFQEFIFDDKAGMFVAKSEKKIVDFMTGAVPRNQHRVEFKCPENLLDQFMYNETMFTLHLKEAERIDIYTLELKVDGHLEGVTIDQLWDCIASSRSYIEIGGKRKGSKKRGKGGKFLVLDTDQLAPIVQCFDELGIKELVTQSEERPLWSLIGINLEQLKELPLTFKMSGKLQKIYDQITGSEPIEPKVIPKEVKASLRQYQREGVGWLERLRQMQLNGVLADDMGLGKTLQAIICLTQYHKDHKDKPSLVVCPTSLVYNWFEEIGKFNPKLRVLVVDGIPSRRKKLLELINDYDVIITSYSLMQKDIGTYQETFFGYVILDEAQHIKNRTTQNARSVKMLQGDHRLILTGTPIENSLEELWSLFDFLMPGLLSSYDRFMERYFRAADGGLEKLRRKLSPFILRRMKKDVLDELPPVSEIVYHCHLSAAQKELYQSYAESAKKELSQLVKKEGFDRVQIHVLATLTRLKQICCHPAIFAKENPEDGDSAKYEMLMELLLSLIESQHKTVIFSQYTKMLKIMRRDLEERGVRFEYLDGATKNRLEIVKRFNEDPATSVFLISLKAGGTGLNLVGADTVIHYDMWWNPAVENQATDRVHRMGQKKSVSSYKLVTLGTIEEKILELQNRKRGLVKQVINTDEEAITKLTWEEVLELLQTT